MKRNAWPHSEACHDLPGAGVHSLLRRRPHVSRSGTSEPSRMPRALMLARVFAGFCSEWASTVRMGASLLSFRMAKSLRAKGSPLPHGEEVLVQRAPLLSWRWISMSRAQACRSRPEARTPQEALKCPVSKQKPTRPGEYVEKKPPRYRDRLRGNVLEGDPGVELSAKGMRAATRCRCFFQPLSPRRARNLCSS